MFLCSFMEKKRKLSIEERKYLALSSDQWHDFSKMTVMLDVKAAIDIIIYVVSAQK